MKTKQIVQRLRQRWSNLIKLYADTRPLKVIHHQEGLYLKRYYVCTICNYWRVYLHNFVRDDPDGLHTHPWKYGFSIVLCGWYKEERRWGIRTVRWLNIVDGETMHRVLKPKDVECWSLFVSSPRCMNWGFLRDRGIYKQYYEVGQSNPKPLSDWYKTAKTGTEWEREEARRKYG